MRARKADAVLASARALFLEHGFGATTVDDVARVAGVSKATVYSNFPDKAALLAALLEQAAAESAAILATLVLPLDGPGRLEDRLTRTAVALARGVLRPEVLQLRRLATAEAVRFPALVARYHQHGPASSVALLAAALRRIADEGLLRIEDAEGAAVRFAYAVVAPLQDRALLAGDPPEDAEVERHATAAAAEFLAAHAAAPQPGRRWHPSGSSPRSPGP